MKLLGRLRWFVISAIGMLILAVVLMLFGDKDVATTAGLCAIALAVLSLTE